MFRGAIVWALRAHGQAVIAGRLSGRPSFLTDGFHRCVPIFHASEECWAGQSDYVAKFPGLAAPIPPSACAQREWLCRPLQTQRTQREGGPRSNQPCLTA